MNEILLMADPAGENSKRNRGHSFALRLVALAGGRLGRRALWVALVVGTVLNLINQGDALLNHGHLQWGKAVLTYLVPFCVSLHGAAFAEDRHE